MQKADDGRWESKFAKFVSDFGIEALADRLDVQASAIYHWLRGVSSPHPANAMKMQALAKERGITISLDEIYQHFREVRSERYRPSSLKPKPARV